MTLKELGLSDEEVQDIIASLVASDANVNWTYDDVNNNLTASLDNSVSVSTLEVDSVTFNQDITDADNNTVTTLSDPVRVTEEASTFTESNVTAVKSDTTIDSGSIQIPDFSLQKVDDFESGDTVVENSNYNNWANSSGTFQAQQSVTLSGSFSGELRVDNNNATVSVTRTSGVKAKAVKLLINIGSDTGDSSDKVEITLRSSGGTTGAVLTLTDGTSGEIEDANGNAATATWEPGTTHTVEFTNIDYANDTYDVVFDGKTIFSSTPFRFSASDFGKFELANETFNSGSTRSVYLDDLEIDNGTVPTSGSVLVKFSSGDEDIESYDLATFQRTLDGETVTVDVVDSNGNVLKSDISKDEDISNIATSKDVQLRANLSRNNTSNNPTVDYLARRFTR